MVDRAGVRFGRLVDLAVDPDDTAPAVSRLLVRRRSDGSICRVAWADVEELGPPIRLRLAAGAPPPDEATNGAELLLAAHVLDRQIFDARGLRLRRVGDVELAERDGRLRVIRAEVGLSALVRRIGLRRLARRGAVQAVDWPELHLASGPGHALQLRSGAAGIHRLTAVQLAALASRLPVERADALLAAVKTPHAEAARSLVPQRRRRRVPLHFRRRAPS